MDFKENYSTPNNQPIGNMLAKELTPIMYEPKMTANQSSYQKERILTSSLEIFESKELALEKENFLVRSGEMHRSLEYTDVIRDFNYNNPRFFFIGPSYNLDVIEEESSIITNVTTTINNKSTNKSNEYHCT